MVGHFSASIQHTHYTINFNTSQAVLCPEKKRFIKGRTKEKEIGKYDLLGQKEEELRQAKAEFTAFSECASSARHIKNVFWLFIAVYSC